MIQELLQSLNGSIDAGSAGIVAVIGAMIGFSSGLFGIGGALIATPLLKLLVAMPPMLALATPLPVALPSAISGSAAYYKNGLIDFKAVRNVLWSALPANLLGTWLTQYMHGQVMMLLTGGFMMLVGITFFVRGWLFQESHKPEHSSAAGFAVTGAIAGFLAGFLAIGGGLVMVPAFVRGMNMKFKKATATSLFAVAVLSVPASIGHFLLGHIDVVVALILALIAAPMSYLGAQTAIKLRNNTLERIYGTCMIAFAAYFLLRQV
jgi:uncharacterized membrane protein YfcA